LKLGDVYDKGQDTLEQIAGNIIDVETEQQKTNELLGRILIILETIKENQTRLVVLNGEFYELAPDNKTIIKKLTT
jgi:hypothetical protein